MHPLYTIGHSHHSPEEFVAMLKASAVDVVADVRSQPYSQLHVFFNREVLKTFLREQGIDYVFLGKELGARREEPECYAGDQARYELIMRQPLFQAGQERLLKGLAQRPVAIMCAEKDPLDCHRFILVARSLRGRVEILNILEDGTLETLARAEARLLEKAGVQPELFDWDQPDENRILKAYEKRGLTIAYRKTDAKADAA